MTGLLRRVLSTLPVGTLQVGIGTVVVGLASYVHVAAAGHTVDTKGSAAFSVLWSIAFSIGWGLYTPVEQEITRITAARLAVGDGTATVLRRGAMLAGAMLAVVCAVLAAVSGILADKLFDGDRVMVLALAGALGGMAVSAVARGVLSGHGLFRAYGANLAMDGALRILLALLFPVVGIRSAVWFALILTIAPVLAALGSLRTVRNAVTPGGQVPWQQLSRGLGLLVGSMMLSQIVVNIAVINVKLLAPGQVALVSALLAATILARVPLFVFGSVQAALLPGLSAAYASGDRRLFTNLVRRGCGIVLALGAVGGLGAIALGPWLVRILFNAPDVLHPIDFVWFSLGTVCYMLALVLGQGLMAQHRHRIQLVCWAAGVAVLAAVTASPAGIQNRVELAYAAGAGVTAVAMLYALWRSGDEDPGHQPGNDEDRVPVGAAGQQLSSSTIAPRTSGAGPRAEVG